MLRENFEDFISHENNPVIFAELLFFILDSSQCGLIDFVISEKISKIKFRFYKKCSFFVVVFVVYFVGIIYFKKSSAVVFSKNSDYILIFTLNIY